MTIGTPTSIGTVTSATGNTASIVITTSANIDATNLVVVFVHIPSDALITVSSVSDGTNTYAKAAAIDNGANFDSEIWYKEGATAVGSGGSITITLSGTTTGNNGYGAEAVKVTGIATTSALDKTATQNASTASPSVTTATLSQADEIAFGTSMQGNGLTTYTEAATFTNLFNVTPGAINRAGDGYKIVAATTAVTYAPTFSASRSTQTVLATFKAAPQTFVSGPKWDSGSFAIEIVSYG